jgi:hypothetical protein
MKRKTKCKNGNTVERFYDRGSRSSVARVIDATGNQIGDAEYTGSKSSADCVMVTLIKENGGEA